MGRTCWCRSSAPKRSSSRYRTVETWLSFQGLDRKYIFLWCNPALRPQALVCSCFIPIYCGLIPPSFRGVVGIWLTVFSSWFSLGFSLWNSHFAQNVFHNVYVTLFASLYGIEAILWEACHEKESLKKKKNGNHSHACFRKMSNWQSRTGNPNE